MPFRKINKLQVTFLVSMLFGYELISFFPGLLEMESSRPVSVGYRIIVFLLGTLVILKNRLVLKPQHFLIYFFWLLYLLRLVYDTAFVPGLQTPLVDYWAFSVIIILTSLACTTNFSQSTILSARKWVLIVLCIVNVWGLYNNITQPKLVPDDVLVRADANESFNTLSFGKAAATMFLVCFMIFMEKNKMIYKILLIVIMALSIFNIFIAGSRGPFIQLVLIIGLYLLSQRKAIHIKYIIWLAVIAIGVFTIFPEYLDSSRLLFERISETGFSSNDSDRIRGELFNSAWEQFLNHPFLGDSIETKMGGTYPHNIVLEALMTTGFVGGIIMIIITVGGLKNGIKYLKISDYNWIGAILILNIISSFSSGSISNDMLLWPLLTLTVNSQIDEVNGEV